MNHKTSIFEKILLLFGLGIVGMGILMLAITAFGIIYGILVKFLF